MSTIRLITTGGTIDKVYFDQKSEFSIGDSEVPSILTLSNVTVPVEITRLLAKDSLDLTPEDRALIRATALAAAERCIVITHGTDTMIETAKALQGMAGKTIVLTGSLMPARFRTTDAVYNVAAALTAAQCLPDGVYITMNGRIFSPDRVRKNRDANRFEAIDPSPD